MKLISACLLGIKCTWDGTDRYKNDRAIQLFEGDTLIPVCPEQLGGLKTPRLPQEIQGGTGGDVLDGKCRVKNSDGQDVTREFTVGAEETLRIAREHGRGLIDCFSCAGAPCLTDRFANGEQPGDFNAACEKGTASTSGRLCRKREICRTRCRRPLGLQWWKPRGVVPV